MNTEALLALARRLAAAQPAPDRIVDALEVAIAPLVGSHWPDVAWRFSRLTDDGCPVEFCISSRDSAFRVTIEVAGPEIPERERLDAGLALLDTLGLPAPDATLAQHWRALQAQGPLRWGCWLGLRSAGGRLEGKIYVEVPPGAGCAAPAPLPGRVRMIGCTPAQRRLEFYATLPQMTQDGLLRLLGEAAGDGRRAIVDCLEALIGAPLDIALRLAPFGASVSDDPAGGGGALFVHARAARNGPDVFPSLFGHAGAYREALAAAGGAGLAHGVLTFAPRPDGLEVRAGLSAAVLAA